MALWKRKRQKTLQELLAELCVPEHADGANKADAQRLVETIQKHFADIQKQMQQPSAAQEVGVLSHITSIEVAGIKYRADVITREEIRSIKQETRRARSNDALSGPEIDSAREAQLAKTLSELVKVFADSLREHYIRIFDERSKSS